MRSAYYIPSAYSKAQIQWVEGFMNGNGYVDLDAANRLGISDPKSFITKRFPKQELLFLKTCVLGETLFKQVLRYYHVLKKYPQLCKMSVIHFLCYRQKNKLKRVWKTQVGLTLGPYCPLV